MITDAEIKINGMKALVDTLGIVEAERFIALIQRKPFDCTKWRQSLLQEKAVRQISAEAMAYRRKMTNRQNVTDVFKDVRGKIKYYDDILKPETENTIG